MTYQKTSVQTFLQEQLKDREFAESFYQGLDELRIMTKSLLDRGSKPYRDDGKTVKESTFFITD